MEARLKPAPMPMASLSYLPSRSGDGYSYGGGAIVSLNGTALDFGEGSISDKLAKQTVKAINSHDKMVAALEALRDDKDTPEWIRTLAANAIPLP